MSSVIFIFVLWMLKDPDEVGTYSQGYKYIPQLILRKTRTDSKGEKECRRVMETLFKTSFSKARPSFLYNQVTGQPLEIDCYNERLGIGCEYNGKQHYSFVKVFHKNYEAFRNQQYRDLIKYQKCQERGIRLIIVPYTVPVNKIEEFIIEELTKLGINPYSG